MFLEPIQPALLFNVRIYNTCTQQICIIRNACLFLFYCTAPIPTLTITGNPRNTSFFQGLDVTLTCSITLAEFLDSPVTVEGTWIRNGTELISGNGDERITISNTTVGMPPYQIILRLNPVHISDAGTYRCTVSVNHQHTAFNIGSVASISRTISIFGRN